MATNPSFVFHDADEYAFLFENAHLLLVSFKRDDAKFLYLIRGTTETGTLKLSYPGQQFTETVLDRVTPIFFVRVNEEGEDEGKSYVLGSYFVVAGQPYGAYYAKDEAEPTVVLFKVVGESPEVQLEVPDEAEYSLAAAAFEEQHGDFMQIHTH